MTLPDAGQIAELIEIGKLYAACVGCGRSGHGRGARHMALDDLREHEDAKAAVPQRSRFTFPVLL